MVLLPAAYIQPPALTGAAELTALAVSSTCPSALAGLVKYQQLSYSEE